MVHQMHVILSVYLVVLALGLDIPFTWILVLVPIGRALAFLPVSVGGGLGVQEAAFVLLFAQVDVEGAAAFSISMLSRFAFMVVPLFGGLAFLLERRKAVPEEAAAQVD